MLTLQNKITPVLEIVIYNMLLLFKKLFRLVFENTKLNATFICNAKTN